MRSSGRTSPMPRWRRRRAGEGVDPFVDPFVPIQVRCKRNVIAVAKARATSSPLPLAGEGQGGGTYAPTFAFAPSPSLPRKREREETAALTFAYNSVLHFAA